MGHCTKDYTVVYSQPSVSALCSLIQEILKVFEIHGAYTADDLFYYGVFCRTETYANFDWDEYVGEEELPPALNSKYENARISFVDETIDKVMRGEINRPEWMLYVEMHANENQYGMAPSTFLRIQAKDTDHIALAQKLINFLYSPNKMTTMVNA